MYKVCNNGVKFSNSSSVLESELMKGEDNDCVVKAIALALDMTYEQSHKVCREKMDRKDRQGVRTIDIICYFQGNPNINGKKGTKMPFDMFIYPGSPTHQAKGKGPTSITVKMFIEKYNTGTYIVFVKNHAFTLKDGVVLGNPKDANSLRTKILSAIKVEDI